MSVKTKRVDIRPLYISPKTTYNDPMTDKEDDNIIQFVPIDEYEANKPPKEPEAKDRTEEDLYDTVPYDPDKEPWAAHMQEMGGPSAPTSRLALPRELNRRQVTTSFIDCFHLIGGVPRMAYWADTHPTEFYKLYARLLPSQATKDVDDTAQRVIIHAVPRSKLDE